MRDLTVYEVDIKGNVRESHPSSLVELLHGEWQGRAHTIFKGIPSDCSKPNIIEKTDRDAILNAHGVYTIAETPAGTVLTVITLIVSIASAVYAYIAAGNIQKPETDLGSSANNSLSARINRERPLKRIEDIAGELRSWPTLIELPYRVFGPDLKEVEYSLMCYGVGEFDVKDAREDVSPISTIDGSGAAVYGPGKMPTVDAPDSVFGEEFAEEVRVIRRSRAVKGGDTLPPEQDLSLSIPAGESKATYDPVIPPYVYPNKAKITKLSGGWIFTDHLEYGDLFDLAYAIDNFTSLSGTYRVLYVDPDVLILEAPDGGSPATVNGNWYLLDGLEAPNAFTATIDLTDPTDKTILGPYLMPEDDRDKFFLNFVCNGLETDAGGSITLQVGTQYAQADSGGNQIGAWSTEIVTEISGRTRNRIGVTEYVTTPFTGPCLVRCRRITAKVGSNQIQDITLDALYSSAPLGVSDFGNVTTVQVKSSSTAGDTQPAERKFNSLVQRILPVIGSGGTIGPAAPTSRFIDYLYYSCVDNFIGRRQASEVNGAELLSAYNDIVSYFGDTKAGEFSYTFDSDQVSFQSAAYTIAEACFSIPRRKNGIISVKFEKPGIPSTIFCHRNKIPGKQTISRTMYQGSTNDGVEFQYVDPDTDETKTITLPAGTIPSKPEKVESKGVRSFEQAYWLAYRRYNKLLYQKITMNDSFTAEGALLNQYDIIGVTNNTKVLAAGGEVIGVDGLNLALSQPVTFESGGHSISLRKRDGTIQVIPCANPSIQNTTMFVTLAYAPDEPVYIGDSEIRTLFTFSPDSLASADYYVVTSVSRDDPNEIPVTCANYTDDYYKNDSDIPSIS